MEETLNDNSNAVGEESIDDFPDTKEVFLKTSLYTKYKISRSGQVLHVEFFQDTIDTYCIDCRRESVFKSDVELPIVLIRGVWRKAVSVDELEQASQINAENYDKRFLPVNETRGHPYPIQDYAISQRLFLVSFHCTRDASHKLFYSFFVKQAQLMKIGQFPSIADLETKALQKYRKVLSREKYRELTKAVGLNANGVGVGAFVYLRRIFEDQLDDARKAASKEGNWDNSKYALSRVDEKILILRDYLPEFLVENRKLYGILSKGVHELSETECKKYFITVKLGIELILDEKIRKKEDEEKIKQVSAELNNILSVLKSDTD